jgi:hypothetical protein
MSHEHAHLSDESLLRAIDGELSSRRRESHDIHLARCEHCRSRLRAIRSAAAAAERTAAPTPIARPYGEMRTRLRTGLAARSAELDRSWRFRLSRHAATLSPAMLAVAAIAVVVVAFSLTRQQRARFPAHNGIEAGALPIRALTPGATAPVSTEELCAGRGPSHEEIAPAVRQAVLRDYGMEGLPETEYELDYLITPELGGSSDRRNLWPERYGSRVWNARVKDELERLLPTLVCRGSLELQTAQTDIAADWIGAYKKYFRTDRPVESRARAVRDVTRDPAESDSIR